MRLQVSIALIPLALVTSGAAQEPPAETRDEAVAAIRRLQAARADAYARFDAAAMSKLLTDDIDFVTSNAYWFRGREETERALLEVIFPMMKSRGGDEGQGPQEQASLESIRFMTPDMAVLQLGGSRGNRLTEVVVRENGQWLLDAYHSTQPAAADGFVLPGSRLEEDDVPVVSAWSAQPGAAGSREEDEVAIRSLVEACAEAFRQKDASAYAAMFAEDADFVTANAHWWRGNDQIEKGLQAVLGGPLPSTLVTESVERVRFLGASVALVHTWAETEDYSVPDARPGLPAVVGGRTTRIVAKQDGRWRVVASQGTNAVLPPPPLRGRLPGIQRP